MAVLYSTRTEAVALRSMCSKNRVVSGHLYSMMDESYFYNEEAIEAFRRITKHINRRGEPPAYTLLCEDVGLSEDSREFLRMAEGQAKTIEQAGQIVLNLDRYRKTRMLYDHYKSGLQGLEKSKIDVEEEIEKAARRVAKLSVRRSNEETIFHLGRSGNVTDIVKDLIFGEKDDNVILTGFNTFDSVNGGFFRGSLVTIGGSTGSGKCLCPETGVLIPSFEIELEDGSIHDKSSEDLVELSSGLVVTIGSLSGTEDIVRFV